MPPHDPLGQLQRLRARLVRKRDLRRRRPCGRPYANGIVVFEGHLRVHVTAMGIEEAKTTITHHHTQVQVLLLIRPHRQVHFHTGNVPVITDVEDGFETGTADGRARVPRVVIVAAKGAQVRAAVGGRHLRQSITKTQAQDAALRGTVKAVAKLRGAARRARRRTAGGGSGGQLFLVACCAVLLVPVFRSGRPRGFDDVPETRGRRPQDHRRRRPYGPAT